MSFSIEFIAGFYTLLSIHEHENILEIGVLYIRTVSINMREINCYGTCLVIILLPLHKLPIFSTLLTFLSVSKLLCQSQRSPINMWLFFELSTFFGLR